MNKTIKNIIILFITAIFLVLLIKVISPIKFVGGDWSTPNTLIQINTFVSSNIYLWSNTGNAFGFYQSFLTSLPIQLISKMLSLVGFYKISLFLLILSLALLFVNQYIFLKSLKLKKLSIILGSFLFVLSPLTFNYILMGWIYVLIALSLFPLITMFFIKSVKEQKVSYALIAGILLSIALVQSQSIVWVPIILATLSIVLIESLTTLYTYTKTFLITIFSALLLHLFWILPMITAIDPNVIGNNIVTSGVSVGTSAKMSLVNSLRLWGSLFNYQFEYSYPKLLTLLTFIPAFVILYTLIFNKNLKYRKFILSFAVLFVVTPVLYIIPRSLIAILPFANVIRDTSRFTVLSVFAYSSVVAIFFNNISIKRNIFLFKNLIKLTLVFIILLSTTLPFWLGGLWQNPVAQEDFRFRKFEEPSEYKEVANILQQEKLDVKALFLPVGGGFGYINQLPFLGAYKEVRDSWSGYSPIPGVMGVSDKQGGTMSRIILSASIDDDINTIEQISKFATFKYIVFRKNTWPYFQEMKDLEGKLIKTNKWTLVIQTKNISLYKNDFYYPHFYVPDRITYVHNNLDNIADVLNLNKYDSRDVFFFKSTSIGSINIDNANDIYIEATPMVRKNDSNYINKQGLLIPTVNHKPFTLLWQLVQLKEKLEIWRIRNNPLEQVDKLGWLASKRIVEINKYNLTAKENSKLLDDYNKKVFQAIEIIKNNKNNYVGLTDDEKDSKYWQVANKLYFYFDTSYKNLGYVDSNIEKTLKNYYLWLDNNLHFSCAKYCYQVELPKTASYQLLVDKKTFQPVVLSGKNDIKLLVKEIDIKNNTEVESTIDIKNTDFVETESSWYKIKNIHLNASKTYIFNFQNLNSSNLIENQIWQEFNTIDYSSDMINSSQFGLIQFFGSRFKGRYTTDTLDRYLLSKDTIKYKLISDWEPDTNYQVSFDYTVENAQFGIAIGEQIPDFKYLEDKHYFKTNNLDVSDLPNRFFINENKVFNGNNKNKINHLQLKIRSNHNAINGYIFTYLIPNEESIGNISIKNLRVEKIEEPKIILHKLNDENKLQDETNPSQIKFVKINPTKYKINISNATQPYTLVFNESFHAGWKLYLKDDIKQPNSLKTKISGFTGQIFSKIIILLIKNTDDYGKTIETYFNGDIKEGTHKNIFIEPNTFETWGKTPIANSKHYVANGYANSWYITKDDVLNKNNYELIVEFVPQHTFYMGLIISVLAIITFIVFIIYELRFKTKKMNKNEQKHNKLSNTKAVFYVSKLVTRGFDTYFKVVKLYEKQLLAIFILGFIVNVYFYSKTNLFIDLSLYLILLHIIRIKNISYISLGKLAILVLVTIPFWILFESQIIANKSALWVYLLLMTIVVQKIYNSYRK